MTFYWISFDKSRGNGSHFWNIYVRYTDTDTESQIVDPDLRNQLHYRGAAHCIEERDRGRPYAMPSACTLPSIMLFNIFLHFCSQDVLLKKFI